MKILIANHLYHPVLGGSVVLTDGIAKALIDAGHQVKITTKTPGTSEIPLQVSLEREPSFTELYSIMRWSDCVIIIEPSLTYCGMAWLARRPSVASLQTWYQMDSGKRNLNTWLRRCAGDTMSQITSTSRVISESWGGDYPIVPNGYESEIFYDQNSPKKYDYVFLGRFIEDKGTDLFMQALLRLHETGEDFRALLIGDGDLMPLCREITATSPGLSEKIVFAGEIRDRAKIASLLNQCKVLAMPNRWDEPFGMVALEALACGCRLVITNSGALPEVTGDYAKMVEKNDVVALTKAMRRTRSETPPNPEKLAQHLHQFHWAQVVSRYLSILDTQT